MYWLLSFAYQLWLSLTITEVVNGYCFIGYNWAMVKISISIFNLILKIVILSSCNVICNILIVRALKRKVTVRSTITSSSHITKTTNNETNEDRFLKARANVVIVLLYTVILHIITWTGYQILILLSAFGYSFLPTDLISQILLLPTYIGGWINPVSYVIRYESSVKLPEIWCSLNHPFKNEYLKTFNSLSGHSQLCWF